MKKSWATSKKELNFFHTKFQVEESEVIVAGGYLEVGGTILRDTDKYTLNGNGRISKQESGFLQKPRKYHRLAHRLTLFSICKPKIQFFYELTFGLHTYEKRVDHKIKAL